MKVGALRSTCYCHSSHSPNDIMANLRRTLPMRIVYTVAGVCMGKSGMVRLLLCTLENPMSASVNTLSKK